MNKKKNNIHNSALPERHTEQNTLFCILLLLLPCLLSAQTFLEQTKLQDTLGRIVEPGPAPGKTMSAIVFLGTDCPISRQYTRTLSNLSQRYPEVRFVGLFTKWSKTKNIRQFCSTYRLPFEVYKDHKHRLAKKLGATVMPEVFLLAPNGEVLYSGAIDNWFFALGKHRQEATEYYLEAAIQAALQHQPAPIRRTEPVGCVLEY
ncbi:MAG: redoxin domain-containing protein [Chitinophagales bacterium]|nr:redoxin domain-containing protein [Chitinophagales bacterium]